VLVLVNFRIYPRRGPKKLRFILSNQKELRTRTENMAPSHEKSAGYKLTSRHDLALSASSMAVGSSEIYALLLNNG